MEQLRKYIRKILFESHLESNLNDNFQKWFFGSKVVDANGEPLVVYHGTGKKFSKFNLKNAPQPIIWFTSDKSTFNNDESGASGAVGKGYIMELYANIKNPASWKEYEKYGLGQLKGLGYDGVILPEGNTFDGFVFEPNQLKSVKNKGEWDSNNKNIFKEEESGRQLGKSLASQIKTPFVTVYRAAPMSSNEFFDRDFVTLSKRFAIEHAESNHVYHEEPQHVIQALISTNNIYDAPNPGEYFYSGPNKKAKEIYISKGQDEYEGLDESLQNDKKELNHYVYHTSNIINRNRIEKNGIIPYRGAQWMEDTEIKGNAVFATNSDNKEDWFHSTFDDVICKKEIEKIIYINWSDDPNFSWDKNNKHIYTKQPIPKNAIKLVKIGTG